MQSENTCKNKDIKNILIKIILVVILLIAILILVFKTSNNKNNNYVNDVNIVEDLAEEQNSNQDVIESKIPSIAFSGYDRYTISKDEPNIELKNPKGNFVDMVFEVRDAESGDIIAITPKIEPGKCEYIDMYSYYENKGLGTYTVYISTYTYVAEHSAKELNLNTGDQMNGLKRQIEIIVH